MPVSAAMTAGGRWLDRVVVDTVGPRRALRGVVRLLGVAALLEALDLHLHLAALLAEVERASTGGGVVPPPAAALAPWIVAAWTVAALAMILLPAPRLGSAAVAVLALWLVTSGGALYSNHLYLLGLFSLAAAFLDLRRAPRREDPARGPSAGLVDAWPARLMQIQLSLVYLFGALAKLNPSFLSGEVLAITSDLPPALDRPAVLVAASLVTVLSEGFLAVGLWSARLRPAAVPLGVALHVAILLGLPRADLGLVVFAVASLSVYPLFALTRHARSTARP